ncbi:MAG: hypothetical protein AB7F35_00975 [Acetobacteraceae bacterium]
MQDSKANPTPQLERLRQRQIDGGFRVGGFFPGEGNPTAEQVAGEINRALDAIEAGDCEEVNDEDLD